jgi:ParB/RepB/Spo0J family partition protein
MSPESSSDKKVVLQSNLKKMIKKTSKPDIISELDRLYSTNANVVINMGLIKEPSYLVNVPLNNKSIEYTIDNIKKKREIVPLIVRKVKDYYEVVVGRRRYNAYKLLNYSTIDCVIADLSDEDACFMTLFNSLDKQYKNVIEIGKLLKYLNEKFKYSLTDLSQITALSISQISNLIRILKLPLFVIKDITLDKINYGQAKALCSLDAIYLQEVVNKIEAEKLSVKETEKLCRSYKKPDKYSKMEKSLSEDFDAEYVEIKKRSTEFHFKTRKQLLNFLRKIKKWS